MPRFAPLVKVSRVRAYGAEVVLAGNDFDQALERALQMQAERGSVLIPAFDDLRVIAGQGSLGLELLEQIPDVEAVIVPVGGGGLIGGIALGLKESGCRARVIGVQTERVAGMQYALQAGKPALCPAQPTIADGIAVRQVGALTLPLVQQYVDDIVTVSETEIASALVALLEGEKTVVEGAGATPLAALLNRSLGVMNQKVVLVLSGGNIDMNIVARVIEKGLVQAGRLVQVSLIVPDRPGALAGVGSVVADHGANILEIAHTRGFSRAEVGESEITFTLETSGQDHVATVLSGLQQAGSHVIDSMG
jgi:threonine dehydratase